MARVRRAAEEAGTPAAKKDSEGGQAGAESSLAQPGRCGQDEVSAVGIPAMMRATGSCWMPRANNARGKVRGALPRTPARGTPPETPGPLSLRLHIPQRSSPSRVRSAAQNPRALDCSGPFRTAHLQEGKGANAKPSSTVYKKGTFLSRRFGGHFYRGLTKDISGVDSLAQQV